MAEFIINQEVKTETPTVEVTLSADSMRCRWGATPSAWWWWTTPATPRFQTT
jgi:hypothetical protein